MVKRLRIIDKRLRMNGGGSAIGVGGSAISVGGSAIDVGGLFFYIKWRIIRGFDEKIVFFVSFLI